MFAFISEVFRVFVCECLETRVLTFDCAAFSSSVGWLFYLGAISLLYFQLQLADLLLWVLIVPFLGML